LGGRVIWVWAAASEGAAMSEPRVTLDDTGLNPVEQKLHTALEEQLTSALRAAARRLAADCAGEPVDVVCRRLYEETKAGLHPDIAAAFSPDHTELCRVAAAIAQGRQP
jgi:hypothetical protein